VNNKSQHKQFLATTNDLLLVGYQHCKLPTENSDCK